MPRQLKVYRTPIGFHDAYVAAPSQKAALEAWGSDANLFARGVAELVTEPALTQEPLAHPGTVVRRLRGSADDHFAALPKMKAKAPRKPESTVATAPDETRRSAPHTPRAKPLPKPKPRPSRTKLDAAEAALDAAGQRHSAALTEIRDREEALTRERRALEQQQAREIDKLKRALERAAESHARALAKWRD